MPILSKRFLLPLLTIASAVLILIILGIILLTQIVAQETVSSNKIMAAYIPTPLEEMLPRKTKTPDQIPQEAIANLTIEHAPQASGANLSSTDTQNFENWATVPSNAGSESEEGWDNWESESAAPATTDNTSEESTPSPEKKETDAEVLDAWATNGDTTSQGTTGVSGDDWDSWATGGNTTTENPASNSNEDWDAWATGADASSGGTTSGSGDNWDAWTTGDSTDSSGDATSGSNTGWENVGNTIATGSSENTSEKSASPPTGTSTTSSSNRATSIKQRGIPVALEGAYNRGLDSSKKIALTFEGGPSDRTEEIARRLAVRDIPATFFFEGSMAQRYSDLVQSLVERGFEIGSLGYVAASYAGSVHYLPSHFTKVRFEDSILSSLSMDQQTLLKSYFDLHEKVYELKDSLPLISQQNALVLLLNANYDFPYEVRYSDLSYYIEKGTQAIQSVTGQAPRIFRPPSGDATPLVIRYCKNNNLKVVLWSLDPQEEAMLHPHELIRFMNQYASGGDIIRLNEKSDIMLLALADFIRNLRNDGYRFVTLSNMDY